MLRGFYRTHDQAAPALHGAMLTACEAEIDARETGERIEYHDLPTLTGDDLQQAIAATTRLGRALKTRIDPDDAGGLFSFFQTIGAVVVAWAVLEDLPEPVWH